MFDRRNRDLGSRVQEPNDPVSVLGRSLRESDCLGPLSVIGRFFLELTDKRRDSVSMALC